MRCCKREHHKGVRVLGENRLCSDPSPYIGFWANHVVSGAYLSTSLTCLRSLLFMDHLGILSDTSALCGWCYGKNLV